MTLTDRLKHAFPVLLLATYGIFLCSYFFFDDYSDPYRFFARVVFVLGFFVLLPGFAGIRSQRLFQLIAFYLLYLVTSGLWSEPLDWYRIGQKLTISLYLLSFLAITFYLVNWNTVLFERMLRLSVVVAALAALLSLLLFYQQNAFPEARLEGLGSLTNINEFSNLCGVFALLALGFTLRTGNRPLKALLLSAIAVFICTAWFGQSRTAFVSMIVALSVLTSLMLTEKRAVHFALVIALVGLLIVVFPDIVELAWMRGKGLRPQIWFEIWEQIRSAPVFGHGLAAGFSIEAGGTTFATAHNAYLQVLWHGGIVGLCIFLLLLVTAFRQAWLWGRQSGDYTLFSLLVFAACTMMTGVDTLIDRPRDQWMLFWLPLALLLAYPRLVAPPASPTR